MPFLPILCSNLRPNEAPPATDEGPQRGDNVGGPPATNEGHPRGDNIDEDLECFGPFIAKEDARMRALAEDLECFGPFIAKEDERWRAR